MPPSEMDGIRNFRFQVGSDILQLVDTDFWIEYEALAPGTGQPELSLSLNSVWQHSDFSLAKGLPRRVFMEDRLKELTWDFVGRKGTLFIDESTPQAKQLNDITLIAVAVDSGELNELIQYSLTFRFPLTSASGIGGVEVARALRFLVTPHNLMTDSEELEKWTQGGGIKTVLPNVAVAPDGTLTADEVKDQDVTSNSRIQKNVTFASQLLQYEFSFSVKKNNTPAVYPAVEIEIAGGPPQSIYVIDVVYGTLTLLAGSTAADFTLVVDDDDYWRVVLRITNANPAAVSMFFSLYPAMNSDGSDTVDVAVVGGNIFWGTLIGIADPVNFPNGLPYKKTESVADTIPGILVDVPADNFVVSRTKTDEAAFKPVFRAAPIRIPAGPIPEVISILGIKTTKVTEPPADTDLERRQTGEDLVQKFIDLIGSKGLLVLDRGGPGEKSFNAHLQQAAADDLGLPDAVTYNLVFITDFVE